MPTVSDIADRHVIIDKRDEQYICFPDVIQADEGKLIVAYNESDKHIDPTRRALRVRTSHDLGAHWGDICEMGDISHCPRLSRMANNNIMLVDPSGSFHTTNDNGETWKQHDAYGITHDMLDRIIDLGDNVLLTTGHIHRGTYPQPSIRQAPAEQMVYRSEDGGDSWTAISVIGRERNLVLCEASMIRLPDGRILALLRENSFVYEPMYACLSDDDGCTWSDPIATPLIGHRPTLGLTDEDRLLVTYRNTGPESGTSAWTGTIEELTSGFKVHGRHENPQNPTLTDAGLCVRNDAGTDSVVRYALRPMTDPRYARATFEAEVCVNKAGQNGCAMRLGQWWRIYPDRIEPEDEDVPPVPLSQGFNHIRLDYNGGEITLTVNGNRTSSVTVDNDHANTRPILFGAPYPFEENEVDCCWKSVRLEIEEPRLQRQYRWEWDATHGFPDQWAQDTLLELKNNRDAALPDFGYSGWTQLTDGTFFCAHHYCDGTDVDYKPLFTSWIIGTRFSLNDFGEKSDT